MTLTHVTHQLYIRGRLRVHVDLYIFLFSLCTQQHRTLSDNISTRSFSSVRLYGIRYVHCVEPVSRLMFLNSDSSVQQQLSPLVFRVVENRAQALRCVAVGGYPPPSIQLHVGRRDVSTEFKFSNSLLLTGGVRGLRRMSIQSERWNNEFTVTADDDETVVKCVAVVPGLKPTLRLILLHVHCKSVPSLDSCLSPIPLCRVYA